MCSSPVLLVSPSTLQSLSESVDQTHASNLIDIILQKRRLHQWNIYFLDVRYNHSNPLKRPQIYITLWTFIQAMITDGSRACKSHVFRPVNELIYCSNVHRTHQLFRQSRCIEMLHSVPSGYFYCFEVAHLLLARFGVLSFHWGRYSIFTFA